MPLHKGWNSNNCDSYRPVSLTSSVLKTLDETLRDRTINHLGSNKFMMVEQRGFWHKRSCLSKLISFLDEKMGTIEECERVAFRNLKSVISKKYKSAGTKSALLYRLDSTAETRDMRKCLYLYSPKRLGEKGDLIRALKIINGLAEVLGHRRTLLQIRRNGKMILRAWFYVVQKQVRWWMSGASYRRKWRVGIIAWLQRETRQRITNSVFGEDSVWIVGLRSLVERKAPH